VSVSELNTPNVRALYRGRLQTIMSTSSDAITALKALAAADRNTYPSNEEIAGATGLDPEMVNDAIDLLEVRGWANVTRTMGVAPFNFLCASITAEGRLTLEQVSASAVESVKGVAVDDWGAPSSKWDDVEIRLQALKDELRKGKDAEDWRDVGNRGRLIIIDAINVAFDGSMVVDGQTTPKLDDAKNRIDLYLRARVPGSSHEALRRLIRKAVDLGHAVTHARGATGVDAFAIAQATVLVVRCIQAIEGDAAAGTVQAAGLRVQVRDAKRIGGETDPALWISAVAENPGTDHAFVAAFEVEMLEPFVARAVRYEYRSDARTPIDVLAENIAPGGVARSVIVLGFFDRPLAYPSACRARIRAVGSTNKPDATWTEFSCLSLSSPSA
jgi:hypothetical protein